MTETKTNIPASVLDFQKRLLDFQRSVFEKGYDVYARLEDQQHQLSERLTDQIPNLPEELKSASDAWWQARVRGRESYKNAVDRSFHLADSYYKRLAG